MNKRILVVGNDPDIRQILLDRLHSYGYVVETAVDGYETLAILQRDAFDGMLFDIGMPKVEDIAFLCQIRGTFPAMPLVMVTAWTDLERVIQVVIGKGPQAYLLKPFDAVQLKQNVERWIGPPS